MVYRRACGTVQQQFFDELAAVLDRFSTGVTRSTGSPKRSMRR